MENNGKPPERVTSYEENAVDKNFLKKIKLREKVSKNYPHQDNITGSEVFKEKKQFFKHMNKNKTEEDMGNRWNNNPCYRRKNIERHVKRSGRTKALKYVLREPCLPCSEEHVQDNMRQRRRSQRLLSIFCCAQIS